MDWKAYFKDHKGTGVLATANAQGHVNAALYSRPHFFDDGSIAFIMRDRRTHANIQENAAATFLFKEAGDGYAGHRFYLTRIREETDRDKIAALQRRTYKSDADEPRFLVFFSVDSILPLVGAGEREPAAA